MAPQRFEHLGRRVEPGVEHIGVDDLLAPVERVESLTNGFEERSSVIAPRWLAERGLKPDRSAIVHLRARRIGGGGPGRLRRGHCDHPGTAHTICVPGWRDGCNRLTAMMLRDLWRTR